MEGFFMPKTPTASFSDINLDFRPRSYFWPLDLRTHVLSSIKGAERRRYVERMFDEGRECELPADIIKSALHPEDRRAAGASHPWFMGGEYLPDQRRREVEIARITIASVTQDVTSVYARRTKHRILYRVVDEYDGGTLQAKATRSSKQPLTLVQLADFFLGGWNLLEVLEMNCLAEPGRADEAQAFFRASSEFYPGFRHLIEQRVEVWLQEQAHLSGDDELDADEEKIAN
jgi:hypothetical protein